jgi:hypothetical protein
MPRVSGINKTQTATTRSEAPPNRKYTPHEECARKMGVVNATIQFTI